MNEPQIRRRTPPRRRSAFGWLIGLGAVLLAAVTIAVVVPGFDRRGVAGRDGSGPGPSDAESAEAPAPDTRGAVGTAGSPELLDHDDDPHDAGVGPAAIGELATITGTNDAMQLVGRRVDLHVDVQERATHVAFWVGEGDNRLLVVLARDNRTGHDRQAGRPSGHGIVPVLAGQRATISGVIRPMPSAEETASWQLTQRDAEELAERKVYVRADSVSAKGHGTH